MTIQAMIDDPAATACKAFYDAGQMIEAADCFNAPLGRGVVPSIDVWKTALDAGVLAKINAAATDTAHAEYGNAWTVMRWLEERTEVDAVGDSLGIGTLDLDQTAVVNAFQALTTAGVITVGQRNALAAMGDGQGSLAITHLGRRVTRRELSRHKLENP